MAADRLDALTYNIALAYLQLGQPDQADAHAARLTTRRARFDDMRDHILGGIQAELRTGARGPGPGRLPDGDHPLQGGAGVPRPGRAHAYKPYEQGDYTNAWAWLQEVDADEAWKAGVTEDITLYKALCALKLGHQETADEPAGQLSSNWRETYDGAGAATP
ncbi:MAG: hypothetical protein ACRD0A_05315 [Acidimicrobiales bacterium]